MNNVQLQPLLKGPTSSTSKPPPTYDNAIPHTHSRHPQLITNIFQTLHEQSKRDRIL